jgi:hypothetical protein
MPPLSHAAVGWKREGVQEVHLRFVWPAQRYERLTTAATIVAAALTSCAGLAIELPAAGIYRAAGEYTTAPATDERVETVRFVLRARPAHRRSIG